MKSHLRRYHHRKSVDPYPFDYALLSYLYIHEDGNDVIDFGGFSTHQASKNEAWNLIRKGDFGMGRESTTKIGDKQHEGIFIHIQGSEDDEEDSTCPKREARDMKLSICVPKRGISRLVPIEDAAEHFWLMTQTCNGIAPYGRMFNSVKGFVRFIKSHEIKLPESLGSRTSESPMSPFSFHPRDSFTGNEQHYMRFGSPLSPIFPPGANSFQLPIAKWVDIQAQLHNPASMVKLKQLLSLFPIHRSVVDKCLYLSKQDSVDMSHLPQNKGGYMFFTINCTPLRAKLLPHSGPTSERGGASAVADMEPIYQGDASQYGGERAQKSIMELRFEAVQKRLLRCCVPDSISVGVILFSDWVITIHNEPFAELDDLLRVIQIQCTQAVAASGDGSPTLPAVRAALLNTPSPRRFTTSFIFSAFFQICVGHCADSIVFAQAVNDLSDATFTSAAERKHGALLRYVTSTRLCFGECSADVLRRENVVAEILRNDGGRNFLLREQGVRVELMNIQSHLQSLKNEICQCYDAITVINWYTNTSYYLVLLRNGNQSLRMLLLLAEMVNVLTVISIIQSIFSMNVRMPFDATANPPSKAKAPFYVLAAILLIFMLWCVRIVWDIFFRKRFKTVPLF